MNSTTLKDGTQVYCLKSIEAQFLDGHIENYLAHGINIKDGDTVFDIGANIGLFGVRLMQQHPNVKVFAFEPIPSIFEVLQANAQKFGAGRFTPLPYGVSEKIGMATFSYYPDTPALSTAHADMWTDDSFGEAVKGSVNNAPKNMRWIRWIPGFLHKLIAKYLRRNVQQINCELCTVSSIIQEYKIPKIDILKIDCEGAELAVLQGINALDWPKIHSVVSEVHDINNRLSEITALLQDKGFTQIHTEKEAGFEKTALINIYATRE